MNHKAARKQNASHVLADAKNINHGTAESWLLYECSLSHQASIMELRNNWMILNILTVATSNWMIHKKQE
jgi:hypothetical protein